MGEKQSLRPYMCLSANKFCYAAEIFLIHAHNTLDSIQFETNVNLLLNAVIDVLENNIAQKAQRINSFSGMSCVLRNLWYGGRRFYSIRIQKILLSYFSNMQLCDCLSLVWTVFYWIYIRKATTVKSTILSDFRLMDKFSSESILDTVTALFWFVVW